MHTVLEVRDIKKQFDAVQAVQDISFTVNAGETLGIVGPNGAGKTTTIKMILGLLIPDQGTIQIFGEPGNNTAARARLGYMPEGPYFYAHLTGRELLYFVGELFGFKKSVIKLRSTELLERVGLSTAGDRQLKNYSKGMLQRICLAQALMNEPELLFLDEPLDGLDPIGRIRMKEILLDLKSKGTAIVLNSHILSDVEIMSDKIAIMDRGRILVLEDVKKLIPKGESLETVFLARIEAAS